PLYLSATETAFLQDAAAKALQFPAAAPDAGVDAGIPGKSVDPSPDSGSDASSAPSASTRCSSSGAVPGRGFALAALATSARRSTDCYARSMGDSMHEGSAGFGPVDESLEAAQERKNRDAGEKLQLGAGDRLLDSGCGWGTLVASLAEQFRIDATGVTLSKN